MLPKDRLQPIIKEEDLHKNFYKGIKKPLPKKIFIILSLFAVAFFINYPFQKKLEEFVGQQLRTIPGCPIRFENLQLELFFPKIILTKPEIPGSCLNRPRAIKLDEIMIILNGVSFSPLGPTSKVVLSLDKEKIELGQSWSLSEQVIKIYPSTLSLKTLSDNFIDMTKLLGSAQIEGELTIQKSQLTKLDFMLNSKNIKIPPQNIMSFSLPSALPVNHLQLKANMHDGNSLEITQFIIGDAKSPIRASISGDIKLNQRNMPLSTLDLKTELSLADDFFKKIPGMSLLQFFLSGFEKKDGFYNIKIKGSLAKPLPSAI